jgi:hypothetical protein
MSVSNRYKILKFNFFYSFTVNFFLSGSIEVLEMVLSRDNKG